MKIDKCLEKYWVVFLFINLGLEGSHDYDSCDFFSIVKLIKSWGVVSMKWFLGGKGEKGPQWKISFSEW